MTNLYFLSTRGDYRIAKMMEYNIIKVEYEDTHMVLLNY